MSEAIARAQAEAQFDSGQFFGQLAQRVACRTESLQPGPRRPVGEQAATLPRRPTR